MYLEYQEIYVENRLSQIHSLNSGHCTLLRYQYRTTCINHRCRNKRALTPLHPQNYHLWRLFSALNLVDEKLTYTLFQFDTLGESGWSNWNGSSLRHNNWADRRSIRNWFLIFFSSLALWRVHKNFLTFSFWMAATFNNKERLTRNPKKVQTNYEQHTAMQL